MPRIITVQKPVDCRCHLVRHWHQWLPGAARPTGAGTGCFCWNNMEVTRELRGSQPRVSAGPWENSTAPLSTLWERPHPPPCWPEGKTWDPLLVFLQDLVCQTFKLMLIYSFNKYLLEAGPFMTCLKDSKRSGVIRARAEAESERKRQGAKRPAYKTQ